MLYTAKEFSNEILNVMDNKKIIISGKEKNIRFLNEYSITNNQRINIIKALTSKNFVEKRKNGDAKIKTEWLYIFNPNYLLTNIYGEEEFVKLYIKICVINNVIYVESFHKDSDY
ncbi:MAG: hypothetical protein IJG68_00580 [Bacilli bacterium]|nr:hypothetical protein [Bacilli bacterium]